MQQKNAGKKYDKKLTLLSRVHVWRAERRITQEQLAQAIGVTRATIVAIEKGDYNPSLELAFKISRYFETDLNNVFSVEE